MTYAKRGLILLLCVTLLFGGVLSVGASAINASAVDTDFVKRELDYFLPITNKDVGRLPSVTVKLGTSYIGTPAYLINDTTYIPFRAAATLAGASVSFDSRTRTAKAVMKNYVLTATDGEYIVYANERPLLSKTPSVILSDGRMYIPVRSLAKSLSLSVEWRASNTVLLTGAPTPLAHANSFYRSDDVYWLSRIINAESRGEPLLGQLAVGSVVLNRQAHRDYPNTIYGVIFDRKYGVQFSPVKDGSIYMSPTYLSTLAAKICLESTRISEDILFFLEPSKANSAWIVLNREYAFTIGNHYFFN